MTGWRFLPEGTHLLAADETLLWQGRPAPRGLARRFLHLGAVTGYFAVLAAWNLIAAHADGFRAAEAMVGAFWVVIPALAAAALLYAIAWVISATTLYTLSDKRVIMQVGVALPIAVTIPLRSIGSADLRLYADGSGDVTLAFSGEDRLAYLLLWPHVRPGRYKKAEPMLRSLHNAQEVAAILAQALVAVAPDHGFAPAIKPVPAGRRAAPAMVRA